MKTHVSSDFAQVFKGHHVIYLSPDAEEVLEGIQENAVYVVGGLVDRNRQPNASITRAVELGVTARRLPIAEHAQVSRTDFFTISDVLKILSQFALCGDWNTVFSSP